jgi:coenzyme PQQ precursor peptide PqqA
VGNAENRVADLIFKKARTTDKENPEMLHKLITTDLEKEELMEWTSPEFEEVSLNCEINSYACAKL